MIKLRRSDERGRTVLPWLDSKHSFSFGEYHDPAHMGFRTLRVINEDIVESGGGFDTHPHRDMEIVTFVIEGALEHRDSLGNSSVIQAGMVQRMTAGKGIMHSEFNHSQVSPVHLLQIWIIPEQRSLPPSYEEKPLTENDQLTIIASRDGRNNSLTIHQNVLIFSGGATSTPRHYPIIDNRSVWIQVYQGECALNGVSLRAGDAVAVSDEESLDITSSSSGKFLLFDLA